jgi:hypothetical protein
MSRRNQKTKKPSWRALDLDEARNPIRGVPRPSRPARCGAQLALDSFHGLAYAVAGEAAWHDRAVFPTRATKPPVGPQWIRKIKHDGYRSGSSKAWLKTKSPQARGMLLREEPWVRPI